MSPSWLSLIEYTKFRIESFNCRFLARFLRIDLSLFIKNSYKLRACKTQIVPEEGRFGPHNK